ncbi:hypothetical protein [Streptomyces sp900105755]|uniref:Uncharacterized protein n=1 Tax=Streptomyces sp. 900105755 TaxID=3154389 RepID=A0ABV1TTZ3_9ACTN
MEGSQCAAAAEVAVAGMMAKLPTSKPTLVAAEYRVRFFVAFIFPRFFPVSRSPGNSVAGAAVTGMKLALRINFGKQFVLVVFG